MIISIEPIKKNIRVDASQCRRRNTAFNGFFAAEWFYWFSTSLPQVQFIEGLKLIILFI